LRTPWSQTDSIAARMMPTPSSVCGIFVGVVYSALKAAVWIAVASQSVPVTTSVKVPSDCTPCSTIATPLSYCTKTLQFFSSTPSACVVERFSLTMPGSSLNFIVIVLVGCA
jgi:hypothetical protein